LEIEAAQVAGDIDYLADEVEAWYFGGLHAFGGKLASCNTACSDLGLIEAFGAGWRELPAMKTGGERLNFAIAEHRERFRLVVQFHPAIGEALGKKSRQESACLGGIATRPLGAEHGSQILSGQKVDFERGA